MKEKEYNIKFKKVSEKPNNSWREGLVEIEFAMDLD